MVVAATTSAVLIPGTGTTAVLPFTWGIAQASDLIVMTHVVATGAITTLAINTNYTVQGAGILTGGTVTLLAGNLATGVNAFIASDPAELQLLLLSQANNANQADLMAALDLACRQIQATRRVANNALQIPLVESLAGLNTIFPAAAQRANTVPGFDGLGNLTVFQTIPTGVVSAAMLPAVTAATLALARAAMGPWGDALVTATHGITASSLANRFGRVLNAIDDYGAKGDGSTDDTTALQAWITACQTNHLPGYLPGNGHFYKISAALNIGAAGNLIIRGDGYYNGSFIQMQSLTQDGLSFTGAVRVYLSNFGISSVGTATAGACLRFTGAATTMVGGFLDRIVTNGFIGIVSSPLAAFTMFQCELNASSVCLACNDPGDSVIDDCRFTPTNAAATAISIGGDPGGLRFTNNKVNGTYVTALTITASIADGDVFIRGNSFEGWTSFGVQFLRGAAINFSNLIICENEFAGAGRGIAITDTTAGWLANVIIADNVIASTGGITVGSANNLIISNNTVADIITQANVVAGIVSDNVVTSISNSSTGCRIVNNVGYNPVGASALSPGASPWAYAAGASPETIYLSAATSITAVTIGGVSILPAATAANAVLTLEPGPFEAIVITYTGALTGKRMIH